MIDIADVIEHLQTELPSYEVDYIKTISPPVDDVDVPEIYVSYFGDKSTLANDKLDYDEYMVNGEETLQTIELHIVCRVSSFYNVYRDIKAVLKDFNPTVNNNFRTALVFTEGGLTGVDNSVQRYVARWRVGFSQNPL